jgi:predicted metal-binding membrane protein
MTAEVLAPLLRHDRAVVLGGLAAVIALAWMYLLLGAGIEIHSMDMGGGQVMAMSPEWTVGYAALIFVMWAVMMIAMMLPSAAPVVLLATAIDRQRGAANTRSRSALFASGYLLVWIGFSLIATLLQWALDDAGLLSDSMAASNRILAGGVLAAGGLYQWTSFKNACLSHCRSPIGFLMQHWRHGKLGAVATGIRHGLFCLGCCWMLMALLFVGGLMNLVWVAAITMLVLIEKTLPWAGRMSRVTGVIFVAWGVLLPLSSYNVPKTT